MVLFIFFLLFDDFDTLHCYSSLPTDGSLYQCWKENIFCIVLAFPHLSSRSLDLHDDDLPINATIKRSTLINAFFVCFLVQLSNSVLVLVVRFRYCKFEWTRSFLLVLVKWNFDDYFLEGYKWRRLSLKKYGKRGKHMDMLNCKICSL